MNTKKRDQILDAALELFAEQGFRGTSTAQIARQASVATGTLFHHFSSKEALINDLYRQIKTELATDLLTQLDSSQGIRETIRHVWFNFTAWALQHPREYRFIKHCEASPYISETLRSECEAKFKPLLETFSHAADSGLLKQLPIELLMNLLSAAMDGFIRYLILTPEAIDDQQLWDQSFSAAWDMIR